jgi:hypothetical protein
MVSSALRWPLALAVLLAGCDLSYANSCFSCDGSVACPSGLSCIGGYCQNATTHCGSTTGGATTSGTTTTGGATTAGSTTGGTTTGGTTTSTGGTTGANVCTNPPVDLCPPDVPTNAGWLSCELGCCPPTQPYACAATSLCYASAEQALSDCGDAGCSTCESSWCGAPPDVQSCQTAGWLYCGNGSCCDPSLPWYCSVPNGQGVQCYATQAEAFGQCQNSCTYCTPPCADSITNNLCTSTSMLTCGNACCDPSLPYYCATNAGAGYCFATNAEAYQFCQGTGISCVACVP